MTTTDLREIMRLRHGRNRIQTLNTSNSKDPKQLLHNLENEFRFRIRNGVRLHFIKYTHH